MANILNIETLLELGYQIPNSDDANVQERIDKIIELNESQAIEMIFGVSLAEIINTELLQATPTDRAVKLWDGEPVDNIRFDGLKKAIANFIYFLILQDKIIYVSASGIASSTSENSGMVTPSYILNRYFNLFISLRNSTASYMGDSSISIEWSEWNDEYFVYLDVRSDFNF